MRTKISKKILYLTLILLPNIAFSQTEELLKKGTDLHLEYRFEEAIGIYNQILNSGADSTLSLEVEERIIQCENGISLLKFAVTPAVQAKEQYPLESFYLHISGLQDKSWMQIPNPLVAERPHPYYNAIYFPEGAKTIYYSAPDNSGSWNIYQTTQISDTLWAEPRILSENLTSAGDEIFPMLSANGKELYFASNGHYGMGGFDLYVSHWDEELQDWGIPENLGFPYSSTADDIFYINSPDGHHSVIVSDRGSSDGQNIILHILEYVPTAIKKELSDIDEIQQIAKLNSSKLTLKEREPVKEVHKPQDEGMSDYAKLVANMRLLSKELDKNIAEQESLRALYGRVTNEDDREFIKSDLTELETAAYDIKSRLDKASAQVQAAEMEFLAKGIIPQPIAEENDESRQEPDMVVPKYVFAEHSYRDMVEMNIEVPEPAFDYSFKILDEAQFAEDNTLPEGLVYQIQLMVVSNKAGKKPFKGMSPIFERKQPSGKYLYTVGLWGTHAEALKYLNQVRKRGFPKAYIVAYNNGKSISVKNARVLEKSGAAQINASYQVVLKSYPDGIPSGILTAIRGACDKDLAKTVIDGQTVYMVGPFASKSEADNLKNLLFGLGVEGMSVEPIKK